MDRKSLTVEKSSHAKRRQPKLRSTTCQYEVVLLSIPSLRGGDEGAEQVAFSSASRTDCETWAAAYLEHNTGKAVGIVERAMRN